jgi:hypothetical protein
MCATSRSTRVYLQVALVSKDTKRQRGMRTIRSAPCVVLVALIAAIGLAATPRVASAAAGGRTVRYRGLRLGVPAGWPVFRLGPRSTACVRFNRHAVYLGNPPADERCPAVAVGRTEAVLVQDLGSRAAGLPTGGSAARVVMRSRGVVVTATWGADREVVQRILGRRLRGGAVPPSARAAAAGAPSGAGPTAHAAAGATFTGLGFDPCSAPSPTQMQAWAASPYRAIGIYLGGVSMACAQTNLTAGWIQQQIATGWSFIPTYVGLQAPTNSCGCAGIQARNATAEGTTAANDAIAHAQAIGLGTRSPIYYDMEAYPLTRANDSAVNAFLSAWTSQLHAAGYVSGVYSSADSGIRDLAGQQGTSFLEPDDLWIASWNGVESTADPNVPIGDWANHQRIHQYEGGHNETYGNVTLNIDNDYVDGAVAGPGNVIPAPAPTPALRVSPGADGSIAVQAQWPGEPGIAAWQVFAGNTATVLTPFGAPSSGGATRMFKIHSQFAYFAVQALGSTGLAIGSSAAAPTPPHLAIYGRSSFVGTSGGFAGVPVGCFVATGCSIVTKISVGKAVIAQAGPQSVTGNAGVLVGLKLTAAGRTMLAKARNRRLAVVVSASDSQSSSGGAGSGGSGPGVNAPTASVPLNLVPYMTSGTSPMRLLTPSPTLRILAATAFVYGDSVGGILADCLSQSPCSPTVTIKDGSSTIAQTGPEELGAEELGYLPFKLTPRGRSLLVARVGNQLGARVQLTQTGGAVASSATGRIALVGYH